MEAIFLALLSGFILDLVFTFLKIPLPAPSALTGIYNGRQG